MRKRQLKPTMTKARVAWLTQLAEHGPAGRPRGVVGYDTMQLGWTEWNWIDRSTGQPVAEPEQWDTTFWETTAHDGERLTALGRQMLKAANGEGEGT